MRIYSEQVFIDEALEENTEDSKLNCQEKVYQRCDEEGFVYNSVGECVDSKAASKFCTKSCSSGKGTFSLTFGMCECSNVLDADDVCDAKCRANQLTVSTVTIEFNDARFAPDQVEYHQFLLNIRVIYFRLRLPTRTP